MGEHSAIEWTDHTFNPWIGCAKVSAGCTHCYAETLMDTRYGRVEWGVTGTRVRTSEANWRKPLAWNRAAEKEGRRYRVFCSSLADVFEDRPDLILWRAALLDIIIATPHLDWQLLTKRPENVMEMLGEPFFRATPNVWIGTSVEDQATADERIPHLLRIPAEVLFLSMEPLLGPVDIEAYTCGYETYTTHHPQCDGTCCAGMCPVQEREQKSRVDWVIVGGESGPKARPMHPDWARSIRDQCAEDGVPFFFKQWGEYVWRDTWGDSTGRPKHYFDDGLWVERVGKHEAGRILDGREWSQFPSSAAIVSGVR